ncbi:MAG TPA: hypothetical protein VFX59_20890, partial [Polyangiales bacterium]|nr:hypothetical protein [Polyangiales bacterium]
LAPMDVFYTGDAGLKSLLIEQLARGDVRPQLELPAPPWVRALWSEGFQPFGPPFVYDEPAPGTVSFPIYFSLLCAPFYALAGLRAALLVPLLALWGVWLQVWRLCRVRGLGPWQTNAALAIVILASPLTLYGAILWEHTLGVLLFTFAIEALYAREQASSLQLMKLGVLAGLGVAVRSELYVPLALITLAIGIPKRALPFALGVGASVLAVWALNLALYGKPLGMHGAQVLDAQDSTPFVTRVLERARSMDTKLVSTMPATLLALYVGIRKPDARRALAVLLLSLLVIPLIVPNDGIRQIGPRYYLFLVPLIALVAVEDRGARWQPVALGALVLLGLRFDVLRATNELVRDYRSERLPALAALRSAPQPVLVVERQETAQELASLFAHKHMLRADDTHQLAELSDRLAAQGHRSFLLVRFQRDPSKIDDALTTPAGHSVSVVQARTLGAFALRAMQTR